MASMASEALGAQHAAGMALMDMGRYEDAESNSSQAARSLHGTPSYVL